MELPKNSKERRLALSLFRNDTNFDLFLTGTTRSKRIPVEKSAENLNYMPCAYCKGLFRSTYLKRHAKLCPSKQFKQNDTPSRRNYLTESHTLVACAADPTETISLLNVKNKVSYLTFFGEP